MTMESMERDCNVVDGLAESFKEPVNGRYVRGCEANGKEKRNDVLGSVLEWTCKTLLDYHPLIPRLWSNAGYRVQLLSHVLISAIMADLRSIGRDANVTAVNVVTEVWMSLLTLSSRFSSPSLSAPKTIDSLSL